MLSGCLNARQGNLTVSVYQPLSGLHQPIVVDPAVRNFEGLKLVVHCVPGDYLDRSQNRTLCRRVSTLFENQGAEVRTVDTDTVRSDPFSGSGGSGGSQQQAQDDPWERDGTDLIVEIRSRMIAKNNRTLSWTIAAATWTLLPAVDDRIFAQDITVRGGDGFLLAQDVYKARLIRRTGVGVWAGNWIVDRVARDPEDRLTGDAAERDLSADMYGQLTQIVYNARIRQELLREAVP